MATAKTVINIALRRLGRLGSGQVPTRQENIDCLEYIRHLYLTLITKGTLGPLRSRAITLEAGSEVVARPGEHLIIEEGSNFKIIPPDPIKNVKSGDGIVDDYGVRRYMDTVLKDGDVIAISAQGFGATQYMIYDGTLQNWFNLDSLISEQDDVDTDSSLEDDELTDALNQLLPLTDRDVTGFSCYLATILADDFGADVPPTTAQMGALYLLNLSSNYGREESSTTDLYDQYRL